MKKRFIPLLALLLSLCIIVPVSIAQIMAAGAVQINVTAKGGSVVIDSHAVADGNSYNVEENATVSIKAVPQDGYVFDSWSVTEGGTITEDTLEKNLATLSVTTGAVTLTANFRKTLTVTLNQAEGGTATIMKTDKAISSTPTTVTGLDDSSGNMVAKLTATANDGYAFSGWKVTYLKNGEEHDANAKGTNMRYQYVIDGNVSKDSIKVGFNDNPTKMYAIYHVSLIVTPQFTKQLDVTIEQSEGGTVTSSNTLTSLASGAQVTLTAAPNEGYGVLGWNVTDKDGKATSDYTLKMANDTATIKLGNTSLKVSAQFSTDAGKFVANPLEANPPAPEIREGSTNAFGKATISGWNNNKNDDLVMTIVPTKDPRSSEYAYLYMPILQSGTAGYADGAKLTFSDDVEVSNTSSESIKNIKFKANCAHPWEEIPFTITDVNGNVKQAKIVLDYPSKGTVSIEGTGKVTVNGSEYANGDVVKAVTGAELKLQAAEASTFAGWEVPGMTLTEEQAKANPLTITAPEGSFTIKAKFQKTLTVTLKQAEGGTATITPTENAVDHTKTTVTGLDDSKGKMVATLTATANDGYAFSGWKVTYLKNGEERDANAKGTNMRYQYVIDGNVSKDSIKVGFNDNPTKMYAIYHVSLIVTPQFTKQLDVTIEQSEGGTVTSSNTLTSLASGAQVTLTAAPNEGYGVLGWNVTDKDGKATSDYTLKMANDTATIKLGNTSLKVSAQFSTDAGKFVANPLEANPPAPEIREGSTNAFGKATISGWNNNKNDDLVMTIVPTKDPRSSEYAYLYMPILQSGTAGYADGAKLTFSDDVEVSNTSSESIKNIKFKANCAHPWEEIPFTITDVNGNVKQAKIVLDYPSKGTVSIEGTGKVTVNGSEYANGDVVKAVTGAELKLQAAEASTFAGWEVPGMTLTEEQAKANPLTITAPEGSFTIKAKFQTGDSDNVTVQVKLMEGINDRSSDKFWAEGVFVNRMFDVVLMNDKSFDDLVAGRFYGTDKGATAVDDNHNVFRVEKGQKVCVKLLGFNEKIKSKVGYVLESLESNIPEADIIDQRTVNELINGRTCEVTYLAFYARQDIVVTGNIHELYNVEIKASSNDSQMGRVELTPTSSTNLYKERTTLLMYAIPEDGYVFKGWTETGGSYLTEAQKSQMTVQFVVGTKDTQFTATFEEASEITPLPVRVNVDYSDKAVVTVNGSRDITSAKPGAQLTVAISDVDEYYLFDHWEITQNGVENADPLFPDAEKKNTSITFTMPSNAEGVTIHAVMKERLISVGYQVIVNNQSHSDMAVFTFTVNGQNVPSGKEILKKGDVCQFTVTPADPERYVLKEITAYRAETEMERRFFVTTNASGSFIVDEWYYSYSLKVTLEEKTEDNARHDITLTQVTGGTITSSNSTAQPNTTVTLTAVPDSGYTLKSWIVKDEQQKAISVTTDKTDRNVGTFTMPKSNVTVTAEFESTSEITPTITSVALVKSADGSLVAKGAPSGDNWTITIPNTVSAETVAKIPEGLSGLNLKIVTPAGVKVKQEGGGGSYEGDWSKGDISCYMPVGEEVTFKATAGAATKDYTIKLIYSGSGEPTEPILSNGSATRISNSGAAVQFSSNVAGNYFYKVVNHSAAAPTVEEILASSNKGTASTGVNNITLSNLGDGARDIYIVVVDASNNRSVVLKIEIPAYGSIDVPDTGAYTITVKAPKGGTITPNRTKANAGDEIIVTVTPDSGYQMVADSLTYTLAVAGGETVKITNNRFTMPEGNVSISCQWETAATTSTGITGFSINGVAGAVNNSTNTITITMPRGTDVTKLTPVIATNGVKSLTPGSGETVDFTNSVTYTATMEDGSTKTYIVTVYVNKGTLSDQFWDKMTDFTNQVPWWEYAKNQQSTSSYPKYW